MSALQRPTRRPWSRLDGIARTEARHRDLREERAREHAIWKKAEATARDRVPVTEDPETGTVRVGHPPPNVLRIVVCGRQYLWQYGAVSAPAHTVVLRSVPMRLNTPGGGRVDWWSWELAS